MTITVNPKILQPSSSLNVREFTDTQIINRIGNDLRSDNVYDNMFEALNKRALLTEEYHGPSLGIAPIYNELRVVPSGAGAGKILTTALDKSDHPGIIGIQTGGSGAQASTFIISTSTNSHHLGFGEVATETILRTGPNVSTAFERYILRAGLFSINADPTGTIRFGVGFEYVHDENGGRWQGITAEPVGGAESSIDLGGVAITADTFYRLRTVVNAAGTEVEFYINGVLSGTATTAADIPTGITFNQFYNAHIYKTAGLANRILYIDLSTLKFEVSR